MNKSNTPIEIMTLTNFEQEVAVLAIKYQVDLMSMKMKDAKVFLSKKDWDGLMLVMKHGKRGSNGS